MKIIESQIISINPEIFSEGGLKALAAACLPIVINVNGEVFIGKEQIEDNWDRVSEEDKKVLVDNGIVDIDQGYDEEFLMDELQEGIDRINQAADGIDKAIEMLATSDGRVRFSLLQKKQVQRSFRWLAKGYGIIIEADIDGIDSDGTEIARELILAGISRFYENLALLARELDEVNGTSKGELRKLVDQIAEYQEIKLVEPIKTIREEAFFSLRPEDLNILVQTWNR